jgi:hypothetical protein
MQRRTINEKNKSYVSLEPMQIIALTLDENDQLACHTEISQCEGTQKQKTPGL